MKRVYIAGIGAIALIATVPFISQVPGVASLWHSASVNAENTKVKSEIELRLEAQKQVVAKDAQGKTQITWQSLTGQGVVQPGDTLRYTVNSANKSDRTLKNLIVNQPIPKTMVYVLKSARASDDTKITYSIDGGKTFVENPTVKTTLGNGSVVEQPAPATAYTNLRLQVPVIAAKTTLKATYETQIR